MNPHAIAELSPDNAVKVLEIIAESRRRAGEHYTGTLDDVIAAEDRVYLAILNRLAPPMGTLYLPPPAPPNGSKADEAPATGDKIADEAKKLILTIKEPFTSLDIAAELQRRGLKGDLADTRQVVSVLLNYLTKKSVLEKLCRGAGKNPAKFKRADVTDLKDPGETRAERAYHEFRKTVPEKRRDDE